MKLILRHCADAGMRMAVSTSQTASKPVHLLPTYNLWLAEHWYDLDEMPDTLDNSQQHADLTARRRYYFGASLLLPCWHA